MIAMLSFVCPELSLWSNQPGGRNAQYPDVDMEVPDAVRVYVYVCVDAIQHV